MVLRLSKQTLTVILEVLRLCQYISQPPDGPQTLHTDSHSNHGGPQTLPIHIKSPDGPQTLHTDTHSNPGGPQTLPIDITVT